jgi:hypothetical protein
MPPGSYGLPVRRKADGSVFLLTAAHVVGSLSWAHGLDRDDVRLATKSGVPGSGDPAIGHVHLSHPDEPCDEVQIDASLITPAQSVVLNDVIRGGPLSGRPRDVEATALDDNPVIVYKRGIRDPALTAGYLDPFSVSVVLETLQPDGTRIPRTYPRTFLVLGDGSPFAKPGDSGSIVVDEDDCVVGMLVGLLPDKDDPLSINENTPAVVVSIIDITTILGLQLLGPDRPCVAV